MEAVAVIGKVVSSLTGLLPKVWRQFRYPRRATIKLTWDGHIVEHGSLMWRALELEVVASKDEEFVIAEGQIEMRTLGTNKWETLVPLGEFLTLPIEVPKNRSWKGWLSGSSLAEHLNAENGRVEQAELRIVLKDYHQSEIPTRPLIVSYEDLRRERSE